MQSLQHKDPNLMRGLMMEKKKKKEYVKPELTKIYLDAECAEPVKLQAAADPTGASAGYHFRPVTNPRLDDRIRWVPVFPVSIRRPSSPRFKCDFALAGIGRLYVLN